MITGHQPGGEGVEETGLEGEEGGDQPGPRLAPGQAALPRFAGGLGAIGQAQPEEHGEQRGDGPERQAEVPLVAQQLGHGRSQHGTGGAADGHAQGIPGDHPAHLVMEMALDEAGKQRPGNGDARTHGHRAADQHGAGVAGQARQEGHADQHQAGGDHPLQAEAHRQARRQGCQQAHAEHRQGGGEADQAAAEGQFEGDAFNQRRQGSDAGPQVDGGKHQRQHQQRAGKGFHGGSIRVGDQAGGETLLPRSTAGQPRTTWKLTDWTAQIRRGCGSWHASWPTCWPSRRRSRAGSSASAPRPSGPAREGGS
ncbi:hypothetical protein D3C84_482830 [compost metagenome]